MTIGKIASERSHLMLYLLVAAVAFLTFLPYVQTYFLGDDWMLLARNSGRSLPPELTTISDASNSSRYRPLSELSLAWEWSLFGLNPVGYHFLNFSLHAVSAILVAVLGQRLTRDRRVGVWSGLIFAVLACHTEAVVWITARHEMLAAIFALLGMLSYIKFRERQQHRWWLSTLLLYIVSLGFKETILALPVLLACYDLFFVFLPRLNDRMRSIRFTELFPLLFLFIAGAGYLVFRLQVGGGYDVPFNVLALPKNLVYYLLMEMVALPDSLYFLTRFPLATLPALAALAIAGVLSVWMAGTRLWEARIIWFSAVWMIVALGPVILIVAERTTYFSSIGWAWLLGSGVVLAWNATALRRRRLLVGLLATLVLGANLVTLLHRGYWWNRAGDVSRSVMVEVQGALAALPPEETGQLWFINLPDRMEYAYAFGDRVLFAAWLFQGQLGVNSETMVLRNVHLSLPPSAHLNQLLTEHLATGPVVAFYWQGESVLKLSAIGEHARQ
ncbi:MAG TPA: hypothetical protein VJG32_01180 [Anaerolineae bacterium]|nr:hypothetical protein [Anaerolineae bacterium]